VKDDKINVEIPFSIIRMKGVKIIPRIDFTDPKEPRNDVALVIEGEKIYVNKYLSINSPVFNAMFYGNFAEKDKIEIKIEDASREEFLEMLHVIY
ncbi:hypothetical protein PENTCL1PPCAC_23843, partial [Pristionchus entomophagus]